MREVLFRNLDECLPKEVIDLEGTNSAVAVAVESGEHGEWLEVGVASEALSGTLDKDLLLSGSLEELFQFILGLNTDHFNLIYLFMMNLVAHHI